MVEAGKAVRFIICCAARSGSTMLHVLLSSHPEITCHGEALVGEDAVGFLAGRFAEKRRTDPSFEKFLLALRDTQPARFLNEIIFDPQGRTCVGAKFKTDEAFQERYIPLQTIIRNDLEIKILMLTRRNVLAQYVSHLVVAQQTGTHLVRGDARIPDVKPIEIVTAHCLDYVRNVASRHAMAVRDYAQHPVLQVCYEDLVFKRDEVAVEILDFLDLDAHELTTDTKKILSPPSRMVTNYTEVVTALTGSGLVRAQDLEEP